MDFGANLVGLISARAAWIRRFAFLAAAAGWLVPRGRPGALLLVNTAEAPG